MSSGDAPATSTTRSALAILGAVEDLTVTPDAEQVEAFATILHRTRDLRAYQIDDLVEHLRSRAGSTRPPLRFGERVEDGGVMGTIVRCSHCGGSGQLHDPDERPEPSEPMDEPDDPQERADALAERMHGSG